MRIRSIGWVASVLLAGTVLTNATAAAAAPVWPTPTPSVPPQVAQPWQAGQFQKGIQLYWHNGGTEADPQAAAARSLDYVVSTGANSVGISFAIYTDGATPITVYAGPQTPSTNSLATVISAAKARNLRVMLRPIIDEANITNTSGAWRGSIQPQNVAAWFASYDQLIVGYAQLAQRFGVQELVVGSELSSLQSQSAQWTALVQQIRATGYTGTVSYNLNWNHWTPVPFQALGVNAYPAVALGDNASVEQLTAVLTGWISQQPLWIRQRLTVQEVGISAQSGMYAHPWQWGTAASLAPAVQANWFSAMCQAAKTSQTQGIYFWMLDSNANPAQPNVATELPSSWLSRPAELSIRGCFST